MAKSASPVQLSPDPGTAQHVPKLRKARERRASPTKPVTAPGGAALAKALALKPSSSSVKPLLIGVGIGAALMGTAVVMRSKSDKASNISPFHGPNSALA